MDRWRSRGLLTKPPNETDPAPRTSRKRRSVGAGLRGDGPGGGLAPASIHFDGGSRSETSAARAVRDRSGARTPAVTASRTRSTVPARGQTSGSNLVAGSSCRTSSRRAASGCLSRADRPITPRTDKCSSRTQVARGRGVLGPREPACPVGDVPGFVSTGPARDCESAAHSGGRRRYPLDRSVGDVSVGRRIPARGERVRRDPP